MCIQAPHENVYVCIKSSDIICHIAYAMSEQRNLNTLNIIQHDGLMHTHVTPIQITKHLIVFRQFSHLLRFRYKKNCCLARLHAIALSFWSSFCCLMLLAGICDCHCWCCHISFTSQLSIVTNDIKFTHFKWI